MSNLVMQRLLFARRRLADLKDLGDAGLTSNIDDRQQLLQEFLFHLVGSVEFVALEVNRSRDLGICEFDVNPRGVCDKLEDDDPIKDLLRKLHPDARKASLPQDPYSPEAMHFRIIRIRNYVCHVGMERFLFRVGSTPTVSILLDPRHPNRGYSNRHFLEDIEDFHTLVETKCKRVLGLLA